jgi:hypothetical protein
LIQVNAWHGVNAQKSGTLPYRVVNAVAFMTTLLLVLWPQPTPAMNWQCWPQN